jgi:hypothetical protein
VENSDLKAIAYNIVALLRAANRCPGICSVCNSLNKCGYVYVGGGFEPFRNALLRLRTSVEGPPEELLARRTLASAAPAIGVLKHVQCVMAYKIRTRLRMWKAQIAGKHVVDGASCCQGTTGSIAGEAGTCVRSACVEPIKVYGGQLFIRKVQHKRFHIGRVGVADIRGNRGTGEIVEVNIVVGVNVESFRIGRRSAGGSRCYGVQCGAIVDRRRGIRRCIAVVDNAAVAAIADNNVVSAFADRTIIVCFLRGHRNNYLMSNARKSRTREREAEVELLGGLLGGHISVRAEKWTERNRADFCGPGSNGLV